MDISEAQLEKNRHVCADHNHDHHNNHNRIIDEEEREENFKDDNNHESHEHIPDVEGIEYYDNDGYNFQNDLEERNHFKSIIAAYLNYEVERKKKK